MLRHLVLGILVLPCALQSERRVAVTIDDLPGLTTKDKRKILGAWTGVGAELGNHTMALGRTHTTPRSKEY